MAASFADAQAQLLALNSEELPFIYLPTPDGVAAQWRWADARWHNVLAAGTYQRDYELRVVLDPAKAKWRFTERGSGTETNISIGGASFSSTRYRGTVYQKSYRKDFAVRADQTDRHGTTSGHTWEARFSTDDVKRPVVSTLTSLGWSSGNGFWSRLFGG